MIAVEDELIPLSEAEAERVLELGRQREAALSRGRATFACTVVGNEGDDTAHRIPSTCVHMEYQWESETRWQTRAWDANGALLSDIAADGQWVEAGGQRWHINYLLNPDWSDSEDEANEER